MLCVTCNICPVYIYAIFLSFNIDIQLNSAQLAYVVCQCFAFILHTV